MAKVLDTILKVLGIVIAVLVILSIIILLLRVMKPQEPASTTVSTDTQNTALWYDPYWDWLNYPYYWFYPSERRHHRRYHDNHHPSTPTVTAAPIPTVTSAPAPAPAPSSGFFPTLPTSLLLPTVSDIIPEVTINNSLIGGISGPINNPPNLIPVPSVNNPDVPTINPDVVAVNPDVVASQSIEPFENNINSSPEPWTNIASLPDAF